MKNYSTCKIVIGTKAKKIKNPQNDITHQWSAYVHAPKNIVKSVQFKLHESFTNNLIMKEYPFEIHEMGWGEFTIQLKIILTNDEKLHTSHFLKLHGEGDTVINECMDEIVFTGPYDDTNIPDESEENEYQKIEEGINYMLKLYKEDD